MTILGPCVKISPPKLKLIFTPDAGKPATLRLEMYSLGHFRKCHHVHSAQCSLNVKRMEYENVTSATENDDFGPLC